MIEPKVNDTYSIPLVLREAVKKMAQESGVSQSDYIVNLVFSDMAKHKDDKFIQEFMTKWEKEQGASSWTMHFTQKLPKNTKK